MQIELKKLAADTVEHLGHIGRVCALAGLRNVAKKMQDLSSSWSEAIPQIEELETAGSLAELVKFDRDLVGESAVFKPAQAQVITAICGKPEPLPPPSRAKPDTARAETILAKPAQTPDDISDWVLARANDNPVVQTVGDPAQEPEVEAPPGISVTQRIKNLAKAMDGSFGPGGILFRWPASAPKTSEPFVANVLRAMTAAGELHCIRPGITGRNGRSPVYCSKPASVTETAPPKKQFETKPRARGDLQPINPHLVGSR